MPHGSTNWRQPSRAWWPDLRPATRRPCHSDEWRRRARGEWRRLGARKASPRVGPPTKAGGARRTLLFRAWRARISVAPSRRHDCSTLFVGAVSTANDPRSSTHRKTRPGSILHANRAPGPHPDKPSAERWPIAARPSAPSRRFDCNTLLVGAVSTANDLGPPPIEKPDPALSRMPTWLRPDATNPALNADPSLLADQPHPISMRRLKHITCGRALDRKQRSALRKRNSA